MKTELVRCACQPITLTLKHQTPRIDQIRVVVDVSKVLSIGDL